MSTNRRPRATNDPNHHLQPPPPTTTTSTILTCLRRPSGLTRSLSTFHRIPARPSPAAAILPSHACCARARPALPPLLGARTMSSSEDDFRMSVDDSASEAEWAAPVPPKKAAGKAADRGDKAKAKAKAVGCASCQVFCSATLTPLRTARTQGQSHRWHLRPQSQSPGQEEGAARAQEPAQR